MSVALGEIETEAQPPSRIPLQHFVVGLLFLVAGAVAGTLTAIGSVNGLVHVHLLLVGWVCVTITGAMTQFVPVWSDEKLHSPRLARLQLFLVGVGVAGLVATFATAKFELAVLPGTLVLLGFWVFVYNISRTLPSINPRRLDVTETHFLAALCYVVVATSFGVVLAADFRWGFLGKSPFDRSSVVSAHVTFAVLGIVLTTILGAMYQLVTMFTQTELHGVDVYIKKFETVAYPSGVALFGVAGLLGSVPLALGGAGLVAPSLAGFGFVVLRKLHETQMDVASHPMLVRYVPATLALVTWVFIATPGWIREPHSSDFLRTTPTSHILLLGFVGYVVVGTLYHVVPFLIWVHRYSNRLGLEDVPMIDDLYDARLERADLVVTLVGFLGITAGLWLDARTTVAFFGFVSLVGYGIFTSNLLLVVHRHERGGVQGLVLKGPE